MQYEQKTNNIDRRLSITVPESFIYTAAVPVRIYDLNYGNHLGHDALISIMHTVRAEFLHKNKFNELDVGGWTIVYLAECFLEDVLEVKLSVSNLKKTSFKMFYSVLNQETRQEIARSCLTFVFFDLEKKGRRWVPVVF